MNAIAVTAMRTLIERLGITSSVMEDEGRHTHAAAASEAASTITRMAGEIEMLKGERDEWREHHDRADHRAFAYAQENERLREALEQIVQWSKAYPLDIFPEPDLKRAHAVLKEHGMTLDAISAHAMRHVVEGVGRIARTALEAKP